MIEDEPGASVPFHMVAWVHIGVGLGMALPRSSGFVVGAPFSAPPPALVRLGSWLPSGVWSLTFR